jgi:hypothetical protein
MHLLAPQVEEPIAQPDLLARILLARDLQRQELGLGLHGQLADAQLDFPGGKLGIDSIRAAPHHLARQRDDALRPQRLQPPEQLARAVGHALRDPVMVAQVDEEQVPVVALAVDPAGKADRLAGMFRAQLPAGMGAVRMHGERASWLPWRALRPAGGGTRSRGPVKARAGRRGPP